MRKIMFIALAAFLFSPILSAQVLTKNSYGTEIDVSTRNGGPVSISVNATKNLTFLTVNESSPVTIYIRYRNGNGYKVDKKEIIISSKNLDLSPTMATYKKGDKKSIGTKTSDGVDQSPQVMGDKNSSSFMSEMPIVGKDVSLSVNNASTHRFMIIGPDNSPFKGVAVAPGETSDKKEAKVGLHQLTALVDMDPEGSSTGRNFAQAVIKLIVVGSETQITVRDENITPMSGSKVKVQIRSNFGFRVAFMSGELAGKAMKRNLKGKHDFDMGFNSLSIQFFKKGIRYQADVEFLVAEGDKIIVLGESNLRNVVSLGDQSTF